MPVRIPFYGIISPLYAQIVFIIIAVLGLGLLVWAVTGMDGRNHDIYKDSVRQSTPEDIQDISSLRQQVQLNPVDKTQASLCYSMAFNAAFIEG